MAIDHEGLAARTIAAAAALTSAVRPQDGYTMRLHTGEPVRGQEPEGWMREDLWQRASGEVQFAPEDPEIRALRACTDALAGLDDAARERVLDYLSRRFR